MPLQTIYFHGSLRVILDSTTGVVLATQCRITGMAASFRYSAIYIAQAELAAKLQWASTAEA